MVTFDPNKEFPENIELRACMKKKIIVKACKMDEDFRVVTLEGIMHGFRGDYLIMGFHGELYPCKGDLFEETYDFVGDDTYTISNWEELDD